MGTARTDETPLAFLLHPVVAAGGGAALAHGGINPTQGPKGITMKMRRWRTSLAAKLLAFQILGYTLILAISGTLQYRNIGAYLYEDVKDVGENISVTLQELLTEHPHLFTRQALEPVVLRLTAKLTSLSRISVIDHQGYIIADSLPA